jgi:hypothetical protein
MRRVLLVALAGFPRDTLSAVTSELDKRQGLISTGVAVPDQTVRGGFYDAVYNYRLADRVQNRLSELPGEFAVLVVYASKTKMENERIVAAFAPACSLVSVEHYHKGTYNRAMYNRKTISQARQAIEKGLRFLNVVFDHVNSRANKTPLLLPARNFSSDELSGMLLRLSAHGPAADDPVQLLSDHCERFQSRHPMSKDSSTGAMCFRDDRGVLFRAPGRARHGKAWDAQGAPHLVSCYLGAKVRLGASYVRGFHYDCCSQNGRISGIFKNCHNGDEAVSETTHVNIAPNDFLRWKS